MTQTDAATKDQRSNRAPRATAATFDDPRAVPKGDAEARAWLDALMRSHGAKLARFFNFKLRDEDLAQDLMIETFFRAWKSRHTFRGEAKASTWLWTIGQRTLAHHFKQKKRREPEVLTDETPEQSVDGRHHIVDRSARRDALISCLSEFNEHIQRSAELVWLLGHSFVEAAELLEESPDTVRMRLKRARRPLQDCLKNKGILSSHA